MSDNCGCVHDCTAYLKHRLTATSVEDKILENKHSLCAGLWHARNSWEFDTPISCLMDECCSRTRSQCAQTMLVCVWNESRKLVFMIRYSNCKPLKGHVVHTEERLVNDDELLTYLNPGCTIGVYSKYQPCHHSSGNSSYYDKRSCTKEMLLFARDILAPRGIKMYYYVSNIFRAIWDKEDPYYNSKIVYARTGISLLRKCPEIQLRAYEPQDWAFLWSMCMDEELPSNWQERMKLDKCIGEVLTLDIYPKAVKPTDTQKNKTEK